MRIPVQIRDASAASGGKTPATADHAATSEIPSTPVFAISCISSDMLRTHRPRSDDFIEIAP